MASGDTKTNQYLDIAANGTRADLPSDTCCETRSQTLIRGVAERIMDVEDEVERLENNPDVADIVATYADLQAYDTSQLTDKDVIRVLQDETHDGDSTYYRWSTETQSWTYIGESKQYTDFVGTDGTTAGASGLVPAPATTDADKFLKSDGTWDEVQAGPTVVQTTGTSTTDVMSQDATTGMKYTYVNGTKTLWPKTESTGSNYPIGIGTKLAGLSTSGNPGAAIGYNLNLSHRTAVLVGHSLSNTFFDCVLVGKNISAPKQYQIGIGYDIGSLGSQDHVVRIGWSGYTPSRAYEFAVGDGQEYYHAKVKDPQLDTDGANKRYTDNLVISYSAIEGSSAPTTTTEGRYVGQLYFDTTNDKKYYLKAIDTTTDPDTYTWEEFGGGIPTNATFWGASYDAVNNRVIGSITFPGNNYKIISPGDMSNGFQIKVGGYDRVRFFTNRTEILNTLAMGGLSIRNKITYLADPTDNYDAANKLYVDTAVASAGATAFPTETFNSILEEA